MILLVFVDTTEETPSKLLVRSPVAALRVRRAVEIPGMVAVVVNR